MQEMAMSTREARKSPFSLVVAMGNRMEAYGELYLDNGYDLKMKMKSCKSRFVKFHENIKEGVL